jgi:hypothetical protein
MAKKEGEEKQNGAPAFATVEEHAKAAVVSAPVVAAVMQAQNWAAGKQVERCVFEDAVKAFLNAPIGGLK